MNMSDPFIKAHIFNSLQHVRNLSAGIKETTIAEANAVITDMEQKAIAELVRATESLEKSTAERLTEYIEKSLLEIKTKSLDQLKTLSEKMHSDSLVILKQHSEDMEKNYRFYEKCLALLVTAFIVLFGGFIYLWLKK